METNFQNRSGGQRTRAIPCLVFWLLKKSSNFTYEMVDTQGENATDGVFKKHRAGRPLLLTRPVPIISPISLVKSAFLIQPENQTRYCPSALPAAPVLKIGFHDFRKCSLVYHIMLFYNEKEYASLHKMGK